HQPRKVVNERQRPGCVWRTTAIRLAVQADQTSSCGDTCRSSLTRDSVIRGGAGDVDGDRRGVETIYDRGKSKSTSERAVVAEFDFVDFVSRKSRLQRDNAVLRPCSNTQLTPADALGLNVRAEVTEKACV